MVVPGDARKEIRRVIEKRGNAGLLYATRRLTLRNGDPLTLQSTYIWSAACRSVYEAGSGRTVASFVYITNLHVVGVLYVQNETLLLPEKILERIHRHQQYYFSLPNPHTQYLKLLKRALTSSLAPISLVATKLTSNEPTYKTPSEKKVRFVRAKLAARTILKFELDISMGLISADVSSLDGLI